MKIGIVTFWQTQDNYGQVLQSFALQRVLKGKGNEPFLIRYTHSDVKMTTWKTSIKRLLSLCLKKREDKHVKISCDQNRIDRKFDEFRFKYLSCSPEVYHSIKELRCNPPVANLYVVGSDQVWSKSLLFKENRTFFLDFGSPKIKRISYAASFAMEEYPLKQQKKLRTLLNRFSAISVREKAGVTICEKIGVQASLVLDPTLLLTGNYYLKLFSINDVQRNRLFIYSLNIKKTQEIRWDEIKQYAIMHNLDIEITPSSGYFSGGEIFGKEKYNYATIEEWLGFIKQSKLVVTTSFHGIVFCILFHTPFVYVPLHGEFSRGNNRILDLLDSLDLRNRVLTDSVSIANVAENPIDWSIVDEYLCVMRQQSLDFLDKALRD